MDLRDFLDAILEFIESSSLTDDEYNDLDTSNLTEEYTKEVYEALKSVLQSRESITGQLKKLKSYFLAKGVDLTAPAVTPNSNIYIGSAL